MKHKCPVCKELPFDVECPEHGPFAEMKSMSGAHFQALEAVMNQLIADEFNSGELTPLELEMLLTNFRKEGNA